MVASRRPYNEWGKEGKFTPRRYRVEDRGSDGRSNALRLRSAETPTAGGQIAEIPGPAKG